MIEWGVIGTAVGFLLGLTGAGGAVIAVPLFTHLVGASLSLATVYSLFAVLVAAAIGWVPQRKGTDWRVVPLFAGFSLVSAALAAPAKAASPDWVVMGLFVAVCMGSLFMVWRRGASLEREAASESALILRGASGGLLLGALVTMTGLGGGVILMPMLLGWMRLPMKRATATSLMVIFLSSLASLAFQSRSLPATLKPAWIGALALGATVSSVAVKAMIRRWDARTLDPLRRWVITAVIAAAVVGVILRT